MATGARAPAVAQGRSACKCSPRRPRVSPQVRARLPLLMGPLRRRRRRADRDCNLDLGGCARARAHGSAHGGTCPRRRGRRVDLLREVRSHEITRDHTRSLLLSAYGLLKPLLSPLFTSADYRMMTSITVADPRSPRCLSAACAHDGARSCVCVLIILHPRCGVVTNVVTSAGSAESVGSLVEALYEYVRRRFAMLIAMLIAC